MIFGPILIFMISMLPCETLFVKIQRAKTFAEAIRILETTKDQLGPEHLFFIGKRFHREFKTQRELILYLSILKEDSR